MTTTAATTSLELARTLAKALQALARDLTYPSESDYPYKAFAAPLPPDADLSPETFRAAAGIGRRYEIRLDPATSSSTTASIPSTVTTTTSRSTPC